ncbi:MAG TPA: TA system VapC family ribonuclease toxin [Opitutales bacterium]|nr:TA system VapC family ribonuclease toxin [Opitutales bacterium]
MTDLPDVNVWLALVDENHAHHQKALIYWQNQSSPEIAFCRVTSLGFLRLSTHPKVLSRPLTPAEAWDIYQRYRNEANIVFVEDAPEIDAPFMSMSLTADFPHHLWTDCYLAALAHHRTCRIISFDADFKRFPELKFLHLSA